MSDRLWPTAAVYEQGTFSNARRVKGGVGWRSAPGGGS
jgi:hypothetical protein